MTWNAVTVPDASTRRIGIPDREDGRKERSFHLVGGTVGQVQDGQLVPIAARGKELAELAALIRLRDAAVTLLDAEADYSLDDESLAPLRGRLNTAYDRYVAAYGPVNRCTITEGQPDPETGLATISRRRPRMAGFRQDPDYATVLALEDYSDEAGQAAKTAIFRQRVNRPAERPAHADTAEEAIRLCLDARGRLHLPSSPDCSASPKRTSPSGSATSPTSIQPRGSGSRRMSTCPATSVTSSPTPRRPPPPDPGRWARNRLRWNRCSPTT